MKRLISKFQDGFNHKDKYFEVFINPTKNISVSCSVSGLSNNYFAFSAGQLFRWPAVADSSGRHTFNYTGNTKIITARGHLQNQINYLSFNSL